LIPKSPAIIGRGILMKGGNTFMADTEKEQPIYDEKVNYILTALKNGKSR
jgi:hypothetical protein